MAKRLKKKAPVVTASVNTMTCMVYVEGIEMPCPLCGVLVRSGERHECKRLPGGSTAATRKGAR
jgi:hypothetical protein